MFKVNAFQTFLTRCLLCFAFLIVVPSLAHASEIGFDGGSDCNSGVPLLSDVFSFTANSSGGFCSGFGNHSGMNFDSLRIVTTIPTLSTPFNCSAAPFFTSCDFTEDTVANTLTILFHGVDREHSGIPVAPDCPVGIN